MRIGERKILSDNKYALTKKLKIERGKEELKEKILYIKADRNRRLRLRILANI